MNGGTIAALIAALVTVVGLFVEPLQKLVAEHPIVATVLGGIGTIIAAVLKPPAVVGK